MTNRWEQLTTDEGADSQGIEHQFDINSIGSLVVRVIEDQLEGLSPEFSQSGRLLLDLSFDQIELYSNLRRLSECIHYVFGACGVGRGPTLRRHLQPIVGDLAKAVRDTRVILDMMDEKYGFPNPIEHELPNIEAVSSAVDYLIAKHDDGERLRDTIETRGHNTLAVLAAQRLSAPLRRRIPGLTHVTAHIADEVIEALKNPDLKKLPDAGEHVLGKLQLIPPNKRSKIQDEAISWLKIRISNRRKLGQDLSRIVAARRAERQIPE